MKTHTKFLTTGAILALAGCADGITAAAQTTPPTYTIEGFCGADFHDSKALFAQEHGAPAMVADNNNIQHDVATLPLGVSYGQADTWEYAVQNNGAAEVDISFAYNGTVDMISAVHVPGATPPCAAPYGLDWGMTEAQVQAILGAPTQVEEMDNSGLSYTYTTPDLMVLFKPWGASAFIAADGEEH